MGIYQGNQEIEGREERSKCPGNQETEGIEITGIKGEWTSDKGIKD